VPFEIDNRYVGIIADSDTTFRRHSENTRRPRAGQIDEPQQRKPAGADVIEHERHQRLYAGHAGMCLGVGLRLFLARVRGMIRADTIDNALRDPLPQPLAVGGIADRRVELRQRAEPFVAIGRRERKMRRRAFGGRYLLMFGEEGSLFLARDVQDMDAFAGFMRSNAAVESRQTGCERGSPSTRKFMRSRRRYSSSE
jgi:hypothetical protein